MRKSAKPRQPEVETSEIRISRTLTGPMKRCCRLLECGGTDEVVNRWFGSCGCGLDDASTAL
jgi:hypothetical protein